MAIVGRIIAGNMKDPISAYYRHSGNSYKSGLERKVDLLRAMISAYRWSCKNSFELSLRNVFRNCMNRYIVNGIIAGRESNRLDVCWDIAWEVFRGGYFNLLLNSQFLRQFGSLLRESVVQQKK
jgi:hypothetical protein